MGFNRNIYTIIQKAWLHEYVYIILKTEDDLQFKLSPEIKCQLRDLPKIGFIIYLMTR